MLINWFSGNVENKKEEYIELHNSQKVLHKLKSRECSCFDPLILCSVTTLIQRILLKCRSWLIGVNIMCPSSCIFLSERLFICTFSIFTLSSTDSVCFLPPWFISSALLGYVIFPRFSSHAEVFIFCYAPHSSIEMRGEQIRGNLLILYLQKINTNLQQRYKQTEKWNNCAKTDHILFK